MRSNRSTPGGVLRFECESTAHTGRVAGGFRSATGATSINAKHQFWNEVTRGDASRKEERLWSEPRDEVTK